MYKPGSPEAKLGAWMSAEVDKIVRNIEGKKSLPVEACGAGQAALWGIGPDAIVAMDKLDLDPKDWSIVHRDDKGKAASTWHYAYPAREEHGIDKAHWDDYMRQKGSRRGYIYLGELFREVARHRYIISMKLLKYDMDGMTSLLGQNGPRYEPLATYGREGMMLWDRGCFMASWDLPSPPAQIVNAALARLQKRP
jgi:hypothetical protein